MNDVLGRARRRVTHSTITTQAGVVAFSSAAGPDGTYCSAHPTNT